MTIELDRPRRLRFDFNSLADAEHVTGAGIGAMLSGELGLRGYRALLWAGLKGEDRRLTVNAVGDLIQGRIDNGGTLEEIIEALTHALEASGVFGLGNSEGAAGDSTMS